MLCVTGVEAEEGVGRIHQVLSEDEASVICCAPPATGTTVEERIRIQPRTERTTTQTCSVIHSPSGEV